MRYLTKGGRALAADYLNLEHDSRLQPGGNMPVSYDWAHDMDAMREACGTNEPWNGKPARTFKHYVFSPDPGDPLSLERLRELTLEWAETNFGEYQVAIVYHDDNANKIPHAHVVVNNVNLATGHRLQDPDPKALMVSAQRIAKHQGIAHFHRDDKHMDAFQRRAAKERPPESRQRIYIRKAEKEIAKKGEYSWVSDIRSRVSTARSLASDEHEFMSLLAELGIEVSDNSERSARRDWIYSIADHPTWRITGERMGLAYGKSAIQARFLMTDRASPEARGRIEEIAKNAIELADVQELEELAFSLEVNERYQIDSLEDYDHVIDELEHSGSGDVEQVRAARSFCSRKGILPQQGSQRRIYSHGSSRTST
ncbi:MAG: relaxase/mobilization nuclease domain-containing protein, partial [Atopobiaceae bacterium]|nr:relaxase/mobilization nuclease domain-containing protein [Atopobiaceae bacterium]